MLVTEIVVAAPGPRPVTWIVLMAVLEAPLGLVTR